MFTLRTTFCFLVLLLGSAGTSFAQNAGNEAPTVPLQLGTVGVKDGSFWVTEFKFVEVPEEQTYTVSVPVTEQVKQTHTVTVDGKAETRERYVNVTRFIQETKTRTVRVARLQPNSYPVPDEMVSFSTLLGKPVTDLEGVRKMLQKESRQAVIKIDAKPIEAFYQTALNSKLVVVHLDPQVKIASTYLWRGWELYKNKDYAKAFAEIDLAAQIDPQNPEPWNNKAWKLATCPDETFRDGKAAVAAAKKALDFAERSNDPSVKIKRYGFYDTLAVAQAAAGDFDQATTAAEDAIKLLPPQWKGQEDDFRRRLTLFKSKQVLIDDPSVKARIVMDSTGTNAFQATFVSLSGDKVTLKRLDGTDGKLPLSKLSENDEQWAREGQWAIDAGDPEFHRGLLGGYEAADATNDWHYIAIQKDGDGHLIWKNAANRSWLLYRKGDELWTGSDCPYGESKLQIERSEGGEVASIIYNGAPHLRKPSAAEIVRERTSE